MAREAAKEEKETQSPQEVEACCGSASPQQAVRDRGKTFLFLHHSHSTFTFILPLSPVMWSSHATGGLPECEAAHSSIGDIGNNAYNPFSPDHGDCNARANSRPSRGPTQEDHRVRGCSQEVHRFPEW